MEPNKKTPPTDPKKDTPQIKEKPTPPEEKPIKEPEVGPENAPTVPDRELPGKENIPPVRDYYYQMTNPEQGYW